MHSCAADLKQTILQVGPLYLAEMAPAKLRGTLNVIFQLFVTIGILIAGLINFGSQYIKPWGWRLPLALAGGPGIFIFVAGLVLPESPNSLAERGRYEEAAKVRPLCYKGAALHSWALTLTPSEAFSVSPPSALPDIPLPWHCNRPSVCWFSRRSKLNRPSIRAG